MEEARLVQALQTRQDGAMEQFQRLYSPLMRYIIAPILSDERDREECLSDVLLQVWGSIGTFDPGRAALTTWLTHLARNAALLAAGFYSAPSWQWRMYRWTSEGQLAPEGLYNPRKYWGRPRLPHAKRHSDPLGKDCCAVFALFRDGIPLLILTLS